MHTLEQLRSGELEGIKRLKLSEELSTFPQEIFTLASSLEILDLSNNRLSTLPKELYKLKKLKIAFFSNNLFSEVPDVFKRCEHLYMLGFKANCIERFDEDILPLSISWLILTDNKIKSIPHSIGKLSKLQKCALAGNQIQSVPKEIATCTKLELLRLSANNIETLPQELLHLPRLSWLAFSGNPCAKSKTFELKEMAYNELEIEELLGEGASGEIYKAYVKSLDKEVAFKLFKGAITSDGYAKDEMNAYMSISKHPNLIEVIAKLKGEERLGLILELISKEYVNLGMPPNFDTCTRDTFEESTSFTCKEIDTIIKAIASASAHLHQNNLMHGDLYAHNILINSNCDVYLGDFGAASFYEDGSDIFERIEVRAFGCLMEDLLNICSDKDNILYEKLYVLKERCVSENQEIRPLFKEMI